MLVPNVFFNLENLAGCGPDSNHLSVPPQCLGLQPSAMTRASWKSKKKFGLEGWHTKFLFRRETTDPKPYLVQEV